MRFPQGIEMLNIFKNFVSKTSILDDFDFYESRQKVMQDKRMRPLLTHFDHHYQVLFITFWYISFCHWSSVKTCMRSIVKSGE